MAGVGKVVVGAVATLVGLGVVTTGFGIAGVVTTGLGVGITVAGAAGTGLGTVITFTGLVGLLNKVEILEELVVFLLKPRILPALPIPPKKLALIFLAAAAAVLAFGSAHISLDCKEFTISCCDAFVKPETGGLSEY